MTSSERAAELMEESRQLCWEFYNNGHTPGEFIIVLADCLGFIIAKISEEGRQDVADAIAELTAAAETYHRKRRALRRKP